MTRMLRFVLALMLIGAPAVSVDASEDGQDQDHLDIAYEELREAVQKIRALHAADGQITLARGLMRDLRRPRIGVLLQSGPGPYDASGEPGAVIQAVTPGGPAEEAGLRAGDVITRFNGETLVDDSVSGPEAWSAASEELVRRSRELEDGEVIILEYIRDDATYDATVVAREMDVAPLKLREFYRPYGRLEVPRLSELPSIAGRTWSIPFGWLDMELVALNPGLGEYFGTEVGVLVVRGPESGDLGLESGDVIRSIGDREVKSPEHAMRILRSYEPEEEVSLDIIRRGQAQTLRGTLPRSPFEVIGESGVWNLAK